MQWLAVISDVSAGRALVVPIQFAMIKVLSFSLAGHAMRYCAKYALHHRQMLTIIVCLEQRDAQI